ncbi:hypothetical protein D3C71_1302520 [compost metagenome]
MPGPLRTRSESAVTVTFVVLLKALVEVEEVVLGLEATDDPEAPDCLELLFTFFR